MTQLAWDQVGERYFEVGIDRGVLYPDNGDGVAWNGLISVSESTSGEGATPYYIDGVKYLNSSKHDEFGGSIEAITYPNEFEECDGSREIATGLIVNQQRRKAFGLSYRTKVGNDVDGEDHGYKIHIIYNALAEPTDKTYSTGGDSPEASTFSWSFTTKPVRVTSDPSLAPLSHVIIESRKITPELLAAIEQRLYGSGNIEPYLLSVEELNSLYIDIPVNTLTIMFDSVTGLSQLMDSFDGDLVGDITVGLYKASVNSRLVETLTPGLYTLEE